MKKSQTNNMLKVQYKVFFENGTLFHSRYYLKLERERESRRERERGVNPSFVILLQL